MSDIKNFTPLWGVWEVESILGEGSFGKVYKAVREDFSGKYECAIKHISLPRNEAEVKQYLDEQLSNDISSAGDYYKQIAEDISKEIQIMHSLRGNTNIVAYEDHLIMPKADGIGFDIFIRMETLTELSGRVRQSELTQADVIKMGIDICTALEVCATNNLIHRDIKSQNVFINKEGNYKLGDFGISRQLERTTSGLSKKGTYPYMAPEVFKGQEYGANVDIYSLGILMYRLLNGNRLPFLPLAPNVVKYDDNEKSLIRRMNGEEIPAPAFADGGLAKVVLKMCEFDRNKRYGSASEVKADLLLLGKSNNVVPIVASVGRSSLTGESVSTGKSKNSFFKAPEPFEEDKTVSMFGEMPVSEHAEANAAVNIAETSFARTEAVQAPQEPDCRAAYDTAEISTSGDAPIQKEGLPAENCGTLIVKRKCTAAGSAAVISVMVDKQCVMVLRNGEESQCILPAGRHDIYCKGNGSSILSKSKKICVNINPSEIIAYECSYSQMGISGKIVPYSALTGQHTGGGYV